MAEETEYEIKASGRFNLGFAELWRYRELFYFFTWRDIKVKYKQTVIGFAWAILQPLVLTAIISLFFNRLFNSSSGNIPYAVYVLSGLLLWNVFSSGISSAGNSMVSHANIIKKIYFPRLIIPISSVFVALFDFFIALLVLAGMIIYYGLKPDILTFILYTPMSLLITSLSATGLGCFLSALNVKYRDFRYIIPFLIQALLFVTPVMYSFSAIKNSWIKYAVSLNPMYCAIELFRNPVFKTPIEPDLFIISLLSSVFIFAAGVFYFRKSESYFADLA